jgi:hypothetical protein
MCDVGIVVGHLAYFVAIWYNLWVIWYIFSSFGTLYQEQSGNPGGCTFARYK